MQRYLTKASKNATVLLTYMKDLSMESNGSIHFRCMYFSLTSSVQNLKREYAFYYYSYLLRFIFC